MMTTPDLASARSRHNLLLGVFYVVAGIALWIGAGILSVISASRGAGAAAITFAAFVVFCALVSVLNRELKDSQERLERQTQNT